jgi:hypothetical protein
VLETKVGDVIHHAATSNGALVPGSAAELAYLEATLAELEAMVDDKPGAPVEEPLEETPAPACDKKVPTRRRTFPIADGFFLLDYKALNGVPATAHERRPEGCS